MTDHATVQNVTGGPLLLDSEGHTLGAGEFGSVDRKDPVTRQLLKAGSLGEPDAPSKASETDNAYTSAQRETERRQAEADAPDEPTDTPTRARRATPDKEG